MPQKFSTRGVDAAEFKNWASRFAADYIFADYTPWYLSMPDRNVILKRDGGFSSRATGKTTTGNQVPPDRTGNAQ